MCVHAHVAAPHRKRQGGRRKRGEGQCTHKHTNNLAHVMQDISEKTAWTNRWYWSMRSSRECLAAHSDNMWNRYGCREGVGMVVREVEREWVR